MTKFKSSDFHIQSETGKSTEIRVTELDANQRPDVKPFEFRVLKRSGEGDYQDIKDRYGPIAATDPERAHRSQKDRRFSLNPLLRDPLSVEDEERRIIEEKVGEKIRAVSEEAKAAAFDQGYQEGLKKGFEESFKKLQAESAQSIAHFNQLVSEAERAKEEIFQANERFLIELIFRIARTVLLKELHADKEHLLRLAKELVNRVGVRDNITLKISPEDADTISMLKGGLEKAFGNLTNLNVETSSKIKPGGCKIETEWNAIDTNLDTQLQGIYEALIGKSTGGES
jgi:flagellar assembly protein FliH